MSSLLACRRDDRGEDGGWWWVPEHTVSWQMPWRSRNVWGEGAVVDMLWFGQSGFFSFLSHTLAYCMRNVIKGELPAQVIVLSSTRHPVAASRQPGVVSHLMLTHCLT